MTTLEDKVAVVTGAGGTMGRAVVDALVACDVRDPAAAEPRR
jgi:NAD(P)-dependent dehydrogenase (short-subunit alcohol dehydrogenase family)